VLSRCLGKDGGFSHKPLACRTERRRNFHPARLLWGDFWRGEIERTIGPATQGKDRTMRGFIVGALAVAVVVLGYLYWQETRNDVSIKLEAPRISTN
jgi:hypothetical protein